jgi:hypothetical protein
MFASGMINYDSLTGINDAIEKNKAGVFGTAYGSLETGKWAGFESLGAAGSIDLSKISANDYKKAMSLYEPLPLLNVVNQSASNPVVYSGSRYGFVVSTSVKNPKDVVNFFVDMMFSSVENYLECSYGLPEHYVIGSNGVVTLKYADEDQKVLPLKCGLINCPEFLTENGYVAVTKDQDAKTMLKFQTDIMKLKRDYISKYTGTGQLVRIPNYRYLYYTGSYGTDFTDYYTNLLMAFSKVIFGISHTNESIDYLLQTYRDTVKAENNMTLLLQKLNERIGKTSKQVID